MSSLLRSAAFELDTEDAMDELILGPGIRSHFPDDMDLETGLQNHVAHLMESITRIGGEVCRLRAEMDGLLEQNATLTSSFSKLKEVISEKGNLDLDDFELACEVLTNNSRIDASPASPIKKIAH